MAIMVELAFAGDRQLSVPTLSVQWDRGGSFVWKVVDGAARRAGIDIMRRQSGVVMVVGELAGRRQGRRGGHPAAARRRQRWRRSGTSRCWSRRAIVPAGDSRPRRSAGGQRRRAGADAGAELERCRDDWKTRAPGLREATKGISALCVRRPVLTIVFNLLIIVAGLAAFQGVEIREMPDVDRPVITIRASYDGAAPETIDTQVTRVLEGAASRVPGVKAISSTSESGSSRIVVEFDESADLNIAANDLRDAVGNAERQLPDDIEDVTIVKADDNSDAIIRLAVTAERHARSRISRSSSRTTSSTGSPRWTGSPMSR